MAAKPDVIHCVAFNVEQQINFRPNEGKILYLPEDDSRIGQLKSGGTIADWKPDGRVLPATAASPNSKPCLAFDVLQPIEIKPGEGKVLYLPEGDARVEKLIAANALSRLGTDGKPVAKPDVLAEPVEL